MVAAGILLGHSPPRPSREAPVFSACTACALGWSPALNQRSVVGRQCVVLRCDSPKPRCLLSELSDRALHSAALPDTLIARDVSVRKEVQDVADGTKWSRQDFDSAVLRRWDICRRPIDNYRWVCSCSAPSRNICDSLLRKWRGELCAGRNRLQGKAVDRARHQGQAHDMGHRSAVVLSA